MLCREKLTQSNIESITQGLRNLKKHIDIHRYKIENPWEFYSDWFSEPARQKGRIRHWQKEIEDAEEAIQNRIDELKKRGENYA